MTTEITDAVADPFVDADEKAVIDHYPTGKPLDAEVIERVHARAQQIREDAYRRHGLVDIAVPAIRELRGELPE
jgi:hypothetical protein